MDAPADLLRFLRDVRLFTRFGEPDLIALAESLHERHLRKNQVLFREGDPGDEMFIVRNGTVLVSRRSRAASSRCSTASAPRTSSAR